MAWYSKTFKLAHAKSWVEQLPFIVAIDHSGNEISNRSPAEVTSKGLVKNTEPLLISGPSYAGLRLVNAEGTEHLDI